MKPKTIAKVILGTVAEALFPSLDRQADTGSKTRQRVNRLILFARRERARWRNDPAGSTAAHVDIWKAETEASFYDKYSDRFRNWFFGPHQVIVDEMVGLNDARGYRHLVEIGCGDGQALVHCGERMPGIETLTGLDINATIIARNRAVHAGDPRLSFVTTNAAEWIAANAADDMLLFSYGGVMEYLDAATLSGMFQALAVRRNVAISLVEPVDPAHDLADDPQSHQFGQERSFSHNHAYLLGDAGFEIVFHEEIQTGSVRWVLILATRPGAVVTGGE